MYSKFSEGTSTSIETTLKPSNGICNIWDKFNKDKISNRIRDFYLNEEIKILNTKKFYLSGTMIEQNSGHIQFDAGNNYKDFNVIGKNIFHPNLIIWSYLYLGKVALNQRNRKTFHHVKEF